MAVKRIAFVMEQHLGHKAYYLNLRAAVEQNPSIDAGWVEVNYQKPAGVLAGLSFIPEQVRGSLAGRREITDGLRRNSRDFLFYNTQVPAVLDFPRWLATPYALSTDITPVQYDRMAALYNHQPDRAGIARDIKYFINKTLFQKARFNFPWSSWAAESLIEDYGVRPEKVVVVPPGVDLDCWKPAPKIQCDGPVRILFVGADFERKGGQHVLQAFQKLPHGAAELVLVTRSQVPETPGVRAVHGLQPNSPALISLYQSSDVFVFPSRAEAFGIAAVEASAAGLPVIASGVGGLKDIVDAGKTGLIVSPDDPEELLHALTSLIDDPEQRETMGRAARNRAVQYFDARANANRIIELILQE